jgi:hypothetical protein
MPLFVQSDFFDNYWTAFVLEKTGHTIPVAWSYLMLLILSGWLRIISPLMPNFVYGSIISAGTTVVNRLPLEVSDPNLYGFLFLGKLPLLLPDAFSGLLFFWIVEDPVQGLRAFKLWMFSPIAIFVGYVIGQYDVATIFLILLSIALFRYKRFWFASLAMGFAVAIEYFPIAILPFFIYLGAMAPENQSRRYRFAASSFLAGILPVILSTLAITFSFPTFTGPTYSDFTTNNSAIVWTIFTHTVGFSVSFATAFNDKIYALPVIFLLVFGYVWSRRDRGTIALIEGITIFFALLFALDLFLAQWFLWVVPFVIIFMSARKIPVWLYLMINLPFFVYVWYWEQAITTYLFLPITTQAFQWPHPIQALDSAGIPGFETVNVFRSLLSGALILFVIIIVWAAVGKKQTERESNSS